MSYLDDFQDFIYTLDGCGWSSCLIVTQQGLYQMRLTHIFDHPLEVLLGHLLTLMQGDHDCGFIWQDEPNQYEWKIVRRLNQEDILQISISGVTCIGYSSNQAVVDLSFEISEYYFMTCVLYQIEKIYQLLKMKDDREKQKLDFPYQAFEDYKRVYLGFSRVRHGQK